MKIKETTPRNAPFAAPKSRLADLGEGNFGLAPGGVVGV